MKLIALRNFRNVASLALQIDGLTNSEFIPKGLIFDLGRGATIDDCNQHEKQMIAQLTVSLCVGDATDSKLVKKVIDEIASDKRREAASQKAAEESNHSSLFNELMAALRAKAPSAAR